MVIIYALVCARTQKAYVGSTKGKLAKRMREHRCLLNNGLHKTAELQADWNSYGPDDFTIRPVETFLDNESLPTRRAAEIKWMAHFAKSDRLYNEHQISMQPTPEAIRMGIEASRTVVGNRWSPETNEKRRNAQLGKPKGHGAKISATKRARRQAMI